MLATMVAYAGEVALKVVPNLQPDATKYAIENQSITQIAALETTAKGRLWSAVLCNGDGAEALGAPEPGNGSLEVYEPQPRTCPDRSSIGRSYIHHTHSHLHFVLVQVLLCPNHSTHVHPCQHHF